MSQSLNQPNILFLFTDQQRFDTISALGNPIIKTPNLDRLVREGAVFDRCYTPSPVCCAARCALATGTYPHQNGCCENMPMPQDIPSFMEGLQAAGYQTHGVGKMHFTPDYWRSWGFESRDVAEEVCSKDDYSRYLDQQGFGHVIEARGLRGELYYIPQPSQLPEKHHETTWVADRSIDFLARQRDRSRPFFLWSSFVKPHPPFEVPTPWNRLYRTSDMPFPKWPENCEDYHTFWNRHQNRYKYMDGGRNIYLSRSIIAFYYATISQIDSQIGRILDALGDEIENTLIVFSSDHGEMLGDFDCYGKRSMYEAAARVPMIVRWGNGAHAGERCRKPVNLLDLGSTFLTAAHGEETRFGSGEPLQSVIDGDSDRAHVFSQFSQNRCGLYLITDGTWKYIYSAADRREYLFNLDTDPEELEDLSAEDERQEIMAQLRGRLIEQFKQDGFTAPIDGDHWRDFGGFDQPDDPDFGLMRQDPNELVEALLALGKEYCESCQPFDLKDFKRVLDAADIPN